MRGCGLWVAGAGGSVGSPARGRGLVQPRAQQTSPPALTAPLTSLHPETWIVHSTFLKGRHFTELALKGRHLTQYQIIDHVCADVHITVYIMLPLDPTSLCADVHMSLCIVLLVLEIGGARYCTQ